MVCEEMKRKAIFNCTFPKGVLKAFKDANNELLIEVAEKSSLAKKVMKVKEGFLIMPKIDLGSVMKIICN